MSDIYNVEAILSERYNRRTQQREWKVKWEGWDDPKDCTWEPLENLKTNLVWLEWKAQKRKERNSVKVSKRKRKETTDPRKKKKIEDADYEYVPLATPGRKMRCVEKPKETVKRKIPVATFSSDSTGLQLFNLPYLLDRVPDIDFIPKTAQKAPDMVEPPTPALDVQEGVPDIDLTPKAVPPKAPDNVEPTISSFADQEDLQTIPSTTADSQKSITSIEEQVARLRESIDMDSQLVQTCLNLTSTIEQGDDLLSNDCNLVHQPLKAQFTMCKLVFAKMCSNIEVDYSNPPVIWAKPSGEDGIAALYYPRQSRISPACWLPLDLTCDLPVLPVAYQSFSESKNPIHFVIGLDLKHKTFVVCAEEDGEYPAKQIASLSGEDIKDICAYSTLPKILEEWVQKHPAIPEKRFCEELGKKIARYILDHSSSLSVMGLKFRSEELEHLCDSDSD